MFKNLRDWWRRLSIRKMIERAGKALARGLWEEIKGLVNRAEHSGLTGVDKYEWVKSQLVKHYGDLVLHTDKGIIRAWVNTAIELAVSRLEENLDRAVAKL